MDNDYAYAFHNGFNAIISSDELLDVFRRLAPVATWASRLACIPIRMPSPLEAAAELCVCVLYIQLAWIGLKHRSVNVSNKKQQHQSMVCNT